MRPSLSSNVLILALSIAGWGCRTAAPTPTDSQVRDSACDTGEATEDESGSGQDSEKGDSEPGETAGETGDSGEAPILPDGVVVVYAVRHAEKDSGDDPSLTEEGQARAEALAVLMADVPLSATYATGYRRTQETVQPSADEHGLPVIIDYDPEDELAAHILTHHGDESVLHAGHSYTIPDFLEALGVENPPSANDYGDLWILTIDETGAVELETSHYGK